MKRGSDEERVCRKIKLNQLKREKNIEIKKEEKRERRLRERMM